MTEKKKHKSVGRTIAIHSTVLGGAAIAVVLLAGVTVVSAENHYKNRFFPGVYIGDTGLRGLSYTEALEKITPPLRAIETNGITFVYEDPEAGSVTLTVPATLTPIDPGTGDKVIFDIDPEASVEAAFSVGRNGSWVKRIGQQLEAGLTDIRIPVQVAVDEAELESYLQNNFSEYETPAKDARLAYSADEDEFTVESSNEGEIFDYPALVQETYAQFASLLATPIPFDSELDVPEVSDDEAEELRDEAKTALERAPLTLHVEDKTFEISREDFADWLQATPQGLGLDPVAVEDRLAGIAEEVDQPAKQGRFRFVDGKIEQFEDGQQGKVLDIPASIDLIAQRVLQEQGSDVTLYVRVDDDAAVSPDNIADLGIKELLGTGHSNMGGSPYNRRLNIARGAELLNGLLIPPDKEFSLLDHLKPFTVDNGYYAELVIKGNQTLPEIGGGLCQIGTTTFRASMTSGLDITERRNHSYAVSYYFDDANNLPGTDATIYDPAPDMKFKNDTGHWLLFETRIDGNDLYFSFYGTHDGRKAHFTAPQISGWVAPPPTKEIEDPSLAPGEVKCTERAHAGTTSNFDYIVEYVDGTTHQETFTSVYKPWQAVCLVGSATTVEPETETEETVEETPVPEPEVDTTTDTETKKKKKKN